MRKFMQSLDDRIYADLESLAEKRGITVQELIRAIIIPDWLSKQDLSLASRLNDVNRRFGGQQP